MTKPNNFILNSDYATLKNDNKGTISLYLGSSTVMNYNDKYTYQTSITVGTVNAAIRCQMYSSLAPSTIYSSPQMQITLQATTSGGGGTGPYPATIYVERVSATTVKLICNVYGIAPGLTQQITGGFQTVTADIVTFLSPFN